MEIKELKLIHKVLNIIIVGFVSGAAPTIVYFALIGRDLNYAPEMLIGIVAPFCIMFLLVTISLYIKTKTQKIKKFK